MGTSRKNGTHNYQRFIENVFQVRCKKYGTLIRVQFGYECLASAYLQSNMSKDHFFVADLFRIAQSAIGLPR